MGVTSLRYVLSNCTCAILISITEAFLSTCENSLLQASSVFLHSVFPLEPRAWELTYHSEDLVTLSNRMESAVEQSIESCLLK